MHRLEMLADDVKPGIRHEMVDIGDPAGDRVLDWNHSERRFTLADRGESILELDAGQRFHLRKRLPAGKVGIGARRALKSDHAGRIDSHAQRRPSSSMRARKRSAGVST